MNIKKEISVNRPPEEVWQVLGTQFADAYKWARGLDHSKGHGQPQYEGARCNSRTCEVPGFGRINEVIQRFDPQNHILSYAVSEGFPDFIQSAVNTWILTRQGSGTKVTMNMEIQTTGIKGAIMGPIMKMNLNKLTTGVISDFKVYVETGQPSEYKVKEIMKVTKKAA